MSSSSPLRFANSSWISFLKVVQVVMISFMMFLFLLCYFNVMLFSRLSHSLLMAFMISVSIFWILVSMNSLDASKCWTNGSFSSKSSRRSFYSSVISSPMFGSYSIYSSNLICSSRAYSLKLESKIAAWSIANLMKAIVFCLISVIFAAIVYQINNLFFELFYSNNDSILQRHFKFHQIVLKCAYMVEQIFFEFWQVFKLAFILVQIPHLMLFVSLKVPDCFNTLFLRSKFLISELFHAVLNCIFLQSVDTFHFFLVMLNLFIYINVKCRPKLIKLCKYPQFLTVFILS